MGIFKHLSLHLFLETAQREKSEQPPSSCRPSGDIKSCGSPWRRKAGRSQISRYGRGGALLWLGRQVECCSREKGVPGVQQYWISAPTLLVGLETLEGVPVATSQEVAIRKSLLRKKHCKALSPVSHTYTCRSAGMKVCSTKIHCGSAEEQGSPGLSGSFPEAGTVLASEGLGAALTRSGQATSAPPWGCSHGLWSTLWLLQGPSSRAAGRVPGSALVLGAGGMGCANGERSVCARV